MFRLLYILSISWLLACQEQSRVQTEEDFSSATDPSFNDFLSLHLLPESTALIAGRTVSFEALGILPYGKSASISTRGVWTSADSSILEVYEGGSPGRFQAKREGTVEVSFTFDTAVLKGRVTVAPKILEDLKLSVPELNVGLESITDGYRQRPIEVKVFGIYSDGTTADLSDDAVWSSEDEEHLSSQGKGIFLGKSLTTTTVQARVDALEKSIPVRISSIDRRFIGFSLQPSPLVIPMNTTMPTLLLANFSNGESQDISSEASFQLNDPSVASLGTNHSLRGLKIGATDLQVSWAGHSESFHLKVAEAEPVALTILSPSKNFLLPKGSEENFKAYLDYSDGSHIEVTSLVQWSVADSSFLTRVGNAVDYGHYKSFKVGSTLLSISFSSFTAAQLVTVPIAGLVSLRIDSKVPGPLGLFTESLYTATGTFTDGGSRLVTNVVAWSVLSDGGSADVLSIGKLRATVQGPIRLKVSFRGLSQTLTLLVGPPVPVSIKIEPLPDVDPMPINLSSGMNPLVARVTYSDGQVLDKTSAATWDYNFSDTGLSFAGYVRDEPGFKGQLTPLALGRFRLIVTIDGVTATKEAEVIP
ncbi:MAG: hypothetical protein H7318_17110 [Oligoflexus sp.]|nr:hypothetical protein [Oligoflexus sp.]